MLYGPETCHGSCGSSCNLPYVKPDEKTTTLSDKKKKKVINTSYEDACINNIEYLEKEREDLGLKLGQSILQRLTMQASLAWWTDGSFSKTAL